MCRLLKKLFDLNKQNIKLSIYGDNILECERMFDLIKQGLDTTVKETKDLTHIYSPLFRLETEKEILL